MKKSLRATLTIAGLATAAFVIGLAGPVSSASASTGTSVVPGAPAEKEVAHDFQMQETGYYCGPAATRVALTGQGKAVTQDQVASMLGTTSDGTDSAKEVTRVLNAELGPDKYRTVEIAGPKATDAQIAQLKVDVVTALTQGKPVVANIAGTITDDAGETHSYKGGHYLPVVGYSNGGETVKIADSYDSVGSPYYNVSADTLANWIASRGYSA